MRINRFKRANGRYHQINKQQKAQINAVLRISSKQVHKKYRKSGDKLLAIRTSLIEKQLVELPRDVDRYNSTRLVFISTRLVFARSTRWLLVVSIEVKYFSHSLHKRSLFPSQLAFIENENIFTLFHNTNCSY